MPRQYWKSEKIKSAALLFSFWPLTLLPTGCNRQPPPAAVASATNSTSAATVAPVVQKETVPVTNMVLIKAGSFMRGTNRVTLTHDFWLGKYEVTQAEYATVMHSNPSHFEGLTNNPVEKVRFLEAQAYCAVLSKQESDAGHLSTGYVYRLPTEAEWEYACRAGTTNTFSFGNDASVADQFAWTLDNSEGTTHPVGQKKPNPWGLYDMYGNVWEWCSDWFAPFPTNDIVDPIGPPAGKYRFFKGGSWNHAIEFARPSNRIMMDPSSGINFVGFRVALGSELPAPRISSGR